MVNIFPLYQAFSLNKLVRTEPITRLQETLRSLNSEQKEIALINFIIDNNNISTHDIERWENEVKAIGDYHYSQLINFILKFFDRSLIEFDLTEADNIQIQHTQFVLLNLIGFRKFLESRPLDEQISRIIDVCVFGNVNHEQLYYLLDIPDIEGANPACLSNSLFQKIKQAATAELAADYEPFNPDSQPGGPSYIDYVPSPEKNENSRRSTTHNPPNERVRPASSAARRLNFDSKPYSKITILALLVISMCAFLYVNRSRIAACKKYIKKKKIIGSF